MSSSVGQPSDGSQPPKPNDRQLREVATLATATAAVAWSLTHDPALAVAVFVAVSGALRPG